MESAELENDTRGWIMCIVSGIACALGASIICVDILVRLIPGKRHFRIQDSNAFLASSLSLSFGVMLFSALYSMLPTASRYLAKDGWDKQAAGFVMMACFVGGFLGIQIISRVLHRYIPSHVVDCDHTHDEPHDEEHSHPHGRHHSRASRGRQPTWKAFPAHDHQPHMVQVNGATESTPLLPSEGRSGHVHAEVFDGDAEGEAIAPLRSARGRTSTQSRRPSMVEVHNRVMSFLRDTKPNCDQDGPCHGYSDPCGQACFKHLNTRSAFSRRSTARTVPALALVNNGAPDGDADDVVDSSVVSPRGHVSRTQSREPDGHLGWSRHSHGQAHEHDHDHHHERGHGHAHLDNHSDDESYCSHSGEDGEGQHHHHVPTNAFLSIGLQTVIAIALHKFPEGFITYATNHASPSLGFNVFMALFVHNIAEGFAMALPLYMALGSRVRAIMWSSLLGGLSQPMGAAVAVAWFKIANRSNFAIDATAYACLFSATAGIMTSVALQLFVESLSLNHNRNLSIFFAFLGMTLLGLSNALVTE